MQKKAMCILIITVLFTNFNLYAKTKTSKDTPGTAIFVMAESNPIAVETKSMNCQSPEITLNIKIPVIKGMTDKKFEKQLNKTFLVNAQKAKKNALSTAKSCNKNRTKDNLMPIRFEFISTFSVIEAPKPYLVLGFLEYQYSGGAHGISYQKYLNINTTDNSILKLKDLFKENTDYKTVINNEIIQQIETRKIKGEYFFPGSQGFTSIKDDQEFYINSRGQLVLVFNIYEIAPYTAGIIEFSIPYEKLSSYLK